MLQLSNHSLVTIVSLDLQGYSRLTEQDEIGTHRALMSCMRERLEPIVHDHQGEIVKSTGDGALIRFEAASEAVAAMIRFQCEVAASEAHFPESRRLVFRIGVHTGAAIFENDDVFGHGVNLAVRLQEAAEPGSIFLSDAIIQYLNVDAAKPLESIGKRQLKNINEKIRVYRWRCDQSNGTFHARHVSGLVAALLLANMVLPTAALNTTGPIHSPIDTILSDRARQESQADELPLHDPKVVLAMNPDRGIRFSPRFGGRPAIDSVRTTMAAVERGLENRQEIAEDAYLQALALYRLHTPKAFTRAIGELQRALFLKSDYGSAHALLAALYWGSLQNRWQLGRGPSRAAMLQRVWDHIERVGEPDPLVHMVLSEMLTETGRHDRAIGEAERAIALHPAKPIGHYAKGRALLFAGRAAEAAELFRAAVRLDPNASRYLSGLALAQFSLDRFESAERTLVWASEQNRSDDWLHLLMAATQGHLGRTASARQAIGRFDRLSLVRRGWFASQVPYVHSWPFRNDKDRERLHLGMVLAGIPEVRRYEARQSDPTHQPFLN